MGDNIMTIRRAFAITFSVALLIEIIRWFLDYRSPLVTALYALSYLTLIVLGFLLRRGGHSLSQVFKLTWPFVLLWLLVGLINFALGRGEVPPNWTPEKSRRALYGYLFASLLFLPIAFGASGIGYGFSRLIDRFKRNRKRE